MYFRGCQIESGNDVDQVVRDWLIFADYREGGKEERRNECQKNIKYVVSLYYCFFLVFSFVIAGTCEHGIKLYTSQYYASNLNLKDYEVNNI